MLFTLQTNFRQSQAFNWVTEIKIRR